MHINYTICFLFDITVHVYVFMNRRPRLCTLHVAVDFLKFPKIAVVGGGGGGGSWDKGPI